MFCLKSKKIFNSSSLTFNFSLHCVFFNLVGCTLHLIQQSFVEQDIIAHQLIGHLMLQG
jgi:hypothetical protein